MREVEKYDTGFIRLRNYFKNYPELIYEVIDLTNFTRMVFKEKQNIANNVPVNIGDNVGKDILEIIVK